MVADTELAWLAGIYDGEGSVGLASQKGVLSPAVQLSMTHAPTIRRAQKIMRTIGLNAVTHAYQEKQPWQRPAHHVRIGRMADADLLARTLLPFAITKREQWKVLARFTGSRLKGRELDSQGRLRRGTDAQGRFRAIPYTVAERRCYDRLRDLNRRACVP